MGGLLAREYGLSGMTDSRFKYSEILDYLRALKTLNCLRQLKTWSG
jgi:hypothetical protein